MSENITFSVSGAETYYHKDWLKSKGFKWMKSSKKWEKLNIQEIEADQLSEHCREFGLYYERSDKGMPSFDYENYLWDGNIPDKSIWYEGKNLPDSTNKVLAMMNITNENIKIDKIKNDKILNHEKELGKLEILFEKIENDN